MLSPFPYGLYGSVRVSESGLTDLWLPSAHVCMGSAGVVQGS